MTTDLPSSAKIIIVGGGIIGCATAYHLARLGQEVLLVERHTLSAGSTWHAAGLVGQLRSNANITRLLGHSVELYRTLEAETGLATGWKQTGGLRLACNEDRWTELKRLATTAASFGLRMELLSPAEAQAMWPLMQVDDLVGATFLPSDGQANPSDITASLARGARMHGAKIVENCGVADLIVQDRRVRGIITEDGRHIACARLVLACGLWTPRLAARAGVCVPLYPVQHQYIITETIPGVTPSLATMRDPDRLIYYKEEVGGLVLGGYEPNPLPWPQRDAPENFAYRLLDENWEHFAPLMEQALARVPALAETGIKQMINGLESFTPDGNFILGEAPECENLYLGCGFNAFGIASAGGAGLALAEWVAAGRAPYDLWAVDPRRFGQPHRDPQFVRDRTLEAYARHYTIGWPAEEYRAARGVRRSPLYDTLRARGAVFGEKLGWERPNHFADLAAGETAGDVYSFTRPSWFGAVAREHAACRAQAVLFDQTSFAKFELRGPGAEDALARLCANSVRVPPGRTVYTQMLNESGGIETDLTITRRDDDRFLIITGTGFATHDHHWIASNLPRGTAAHLIDVTSAYAVLSLMGPRARDILAAVTLADVSNEALPFAHAAEIFIGGAPVLAIRLTYVGELGYELHVPVDSAAHVYARLTGAGQAHGLRDAGYRAMESLRLEKAYRAWGAELGPDHSPYMAGLGFAVKLKSGDDFIGRDALLAQRAKKLPRLLAGFRIDDPRAVLLGRETIYRNGVRAGWLASGGYTHHCAAMIGYGYVRDEGGVDRDYVMAGQYEIDIAGERFPATVSLEPFYDPQGSRIRA